MRALVTALALLILIWLALGAWQWWQRSRTDEDWTRVDSVGAVVLGTIGVVLCGAAVRIARPL